jgi:hypothetical protein
MHASTSEYEYVGLRDTLGVMEEYTVVATYADTAVVKEI